MHDKQGHLELSDSDQSLGSLVTHFPLSDAEKNRINKLIAGKGSPRDIITKYCSQTRLFRDEFVKVPISGFRPVRGQKALNPQTLKAFFDFLKSPRERPHGLCWHIYRQCVTMYVQTEMSALQKLLTDCVYTEEKASSFDLLQSICSNAFEFGVTDNDVSKLYECVWFERIDNFTDLLELCKKNDPTKVQAKQIRDLSSTIEHLQQSIEELKIDAKKNNVSLVASRESMLEKISGLSTGQVALSENIQQAKTACTQQFQAFESTVKDLISQNKPKNDIEDELTKFRKKLENEVATSYEQRIKELEEGLSARESQVTSLDNKVQSRLNSFEDDLLTLADRPDSVTLDSCKSVVGKELIPLLERQDAIEETIQKLAKSGVQSAGGVGTKFRSPLTLHAPVSKMMPNVVSETDFLRYWGQYLLKHNKVFTIEQILAFHCSFLANNVIVADYDVALSWIHCLGWERFSMDLVASPAWCEEQDWQDGILHLFGAAKVSDPRVLTLHNYDVGIVDCYLAPTVHLWALKRKSYSQFCKLFLVPTDDSVPLTSNLLNHASITINEALEEWPQLKLSRDFGRDFFKTPLQTCTVDPASVAQWKVVNNAYEASYQSLITAIKGLDIRVDSWIIELCSKTIAECGRFFAENSAIQIGMVTHLLPWIRHRHGQDDYELVKRFLTEFFYL